MEKMKKLIVIALVLVGHAALLAQTATVTDFGQLYSTYAFEESDIDIIKGAVSSTEMPNVLAYATEDLWPAGISTLSERATTRPKMYNYKLDYVCSFGTYTLLRAAKSKNSHMTGNMALSYDIYFVVATSSVTRNGGSTSSTSTTTSGSNRRERGTTTTSSSSSSSGTSSSTGSSGGVFKTAIVTNFGEVYPTYTPSSSEQTEIRNIAGQKVLNDILSYGTETGWPTDLNTYDQRQNNRYKMYDYTLDYICEIGSKTIVRAAKSKNSHMESSMMGSHDLYFVMLSSVVTKSGSSSSAATNSITQSPSNSGVYKATVSDYNELYSTPTISSGFEDAIRSATGLSNISNILLWATEDYWPSGLTTLDLRNENRSRMYYYVTEYVCTYDTYTLIKVPKAKNNHMQTDLTLTHDIYFVVGKDYVTKTKQ